jgi:hypothetical protein
MMSEKIKVAILGSDTYENSKKIKNHIYLWKQDFGDNLKRYTEKQKKSLVIKT